MRKLLVVLSMLVLACGDDVTGPDHANLAGTWRFNFTNMNGVVSGTAVSCSAGTVDFTISQTGTDFSGVQVGAGRMTCSSQGQTIIDSNIGGETIVSGTVNGASVSFRLGTIDGQHTGTVSGTSITGTAQWVFEGLTLNGSFNAARL